MKHPLHSLSSKIIAFILTFTFCLTPVAQALTVEQFQTLLKEYYIDDVSDCVLEHDTVAEILEALGDPYTLYMTAAQYQAFLSSMQDTVVVGIGISAVAGEKGLLLSHVYEKSPAEEAGLISGDVITEVDGKVTAGQPAEVITGWISGQEGSTIMLQVLHSDGTTSAYTIVRRSIVIPSTQVEQKDNVGLILCNAFGPETVQHFVEGTQKYSNSDVWLIDLRNNPGGDVYAATQSLGVFLGKRDMFYLRNGSENYIRYTSTQEAATIRPVILLSSQWTASSAEIFSGVIRDQNAGLIVGTRTYGKGVAQILLDNKQLPDYFMDGDAAKITAYRYYTTSGSTADQIGILPHLLVDAQQADDVALLLCAKEPGYTNTNTLRLHIGSLRWYVDLNDAMKHRSDFLLLLQALPPSAELYQGVGSGEWEKISLEDFVNVRGLTEYTPRRFPDSNTCTFTSAIDTLSTYNLISGYEDGLFHPEKTMTRAELCALLAQALNLRSRAQVQFSDVPNDAWYATDVKAVCSAGLMEGVGNKKFQPNGTVSHEEIITVLSRLSATLNTFLHETAKKGMPDSNHVPETYSNWSKKWVWLLSESQYEISGLPLNLLYDDPSNIAPREASTRGEAAALLYEVLSYIDIIPA